MVSPELLRRYPFFAGLSRDQIVALAKTADEVSADTGHYFFHEADELKRFFLTVEGAVAIVIELPERDVEHKLAEQLSRELQTRDVVVTTIGSGDVFGWSGLVPPHTASAGAKAATPCRVVVFECEELRGIYEKDTEFGRLMMQRAAQVIRNRLRDMRIETVAHLVS